MSATSDPVWRRGWALLWRPSWAARRPWVLALVFSLANIGGSASLGWFLGWQANDEPGDTVWPLRWGVLAASALTLFLGARGWAWRNEMRRTYGDAVIVVEKSSGWEGNRGRDAFLRRVAESHEDVLQVPGPFRLRAGWHWGLDHESAHKWQSRTAELCRSYEIVLATSKRDRPTTLYVWAWWPVSVALGWYAGRLDREGQLRVAGRPSYGRLARAADPGPLGAAAALGDPALGRPLSSPRLSREVLLTDDCVTPATAPRTWGKATAPKGRVLLARFNEMPFSDEADGNPPTLCLHDASMSDSVGQFLARAAGGTIELRELAAPPADRLHPLSHAGQLAREAAEWIARESDGADLVFLALQVPPEVSLLLGAAAQELGDRWPRHLWPLNWRRGNTFVVPSLDLGRAGMAALEAHHELSETALPDGRSPGRAVREHALRLRVPLGR